MESFAAQLAAQWPTVQYITRESITTIREEISAADLGSATVDNRGPNPKRRGPSSQLGLREWPRSGHGLAQCDDDGFTGQTISLPGSQTSIGCWREVAHRGCCPGQRS